MFHQGPIEKTLTVARTNPVLLTEIIVTALSPEGYHIATSAGSPLEDWLSDGSIILRQGSVYTFSSDMTNGQGPVAGSETYQFRLDMTEPVLQGFARKSLTRFYVTSAPNLQEHSFADQVTLEPDEETESEPELIEIDESFLASSVLHTRYSLPASSAQEQDLGLNDHKSVNDYPEESKRLRARALTVPISTSQDDCTLYLRTSDLGKVGVLNGDWVSLADFSFTIESSYRHQAIAHASESSEFRLVRVSARDDLVHPP